MATVYEIATKISMQNGVSPILGIIAKDLLKLEGSIGCIASKLTSLNRTSATVVGGLAALGGTGLN